MAARIPIVPVPEIEKEPRRASRVIYQNFTNLKDAIERAIKTGGFVAGGTTYSGDATGTVPVPTVVGLRGKTLTAPSAGDDQKLVQYDDGSSSFIYAAFADLLAVILTTSGDMLYRSGSSMTRLAIGGANMFMVVNTGGTLPVWATLSAMIDAVIGSTRGSVLYRGAGGWAALTPDTDGYVLTDGGVGADPAWEAPSGGGGTPPDDFDLLTDGVSSLIFAGGDVVWIT